MGGLRVATFTGTNGADNLLGTSGNDIVNPLLGRDTVDGAAGFDTLNLDWSAQTAGAASTITAAGSGSFSGTLAADLGGTNSVRLANIESIVATFSGGGDTVTLDATPLAGGALVNLSGGAGFDTLIADFSAFAATSFAMGVNFLIAANHGAYAGFEQFALTLGGGTNTVTTQYGNDTVRAGSGSNTINTGDGNDVIWSAGGVDRIDGGAGSDSWHGDYSGWSADLSFGFDGYRGEGALNTGLSFTHIENASLVTGSGNDAFFLAGPRTVTVDGGAGTDQLIWDQTGAIGQPPSAEFDAGPAGTFTGWIDNASFAGIEQINVALSDDDNYAFVDTALLAAGAGPVPATLNLDGGAGFDTLAVDFMTFAAITFTVDALGAIASPYGKFLNFEQFGVALAGGTNTVVTGAGDDTIFSSGGVDQIDCGAGFDSWTGDWSASAANLSFVFDGTARTATSSTGTLVTNVEDGTLNDTMTGGSGVDLLTYEDATTAVKISLALVGVAQLTGGAGTDRLDDTFEHLTGSAFNDTLTGNALNNVLIGLAGIDKLDGGAGADTMIGGLGNDTYVVDNPGDVVIENAGEGTDVVNSSISYTLPENIENLVFTGSMSLTGIGNTLANSITANTAANLLYGLDGKDILNGGGGDDTLVGGRAADTLTGGSGADAFRFDVLEVSTNRDTIRDFTPGADRIELVRSVFTVLAANPLGPLPPGEVAFGSAATTPGQHLVYNIANGLLSYDPDGSGAAAAIQIAILSTKPAISAMDIWLI